MGYQQAATRTKFTKTHQPRFRAATFLVIALFCAGVSAQRGRPAPGPGVGSQQACEALMDSSSGGHAAVGCKWVQTWGSPAVNATTTATQPYFPTVTAQTFGVPGGIAVPGVAVSPAIAPPASGTTTTAARFVNTTVRHMVRVSVGGSKIRLRLSNAFTPGELRIDDLRIALWDKAACPEPLPPVAPGTLSRGPACSNIVPGSDTPLTLGGSRSVVIPAGQDVYTDPANFTVPSLGEVAISMYFEALTPPVTTHGFGARTAYRVVGLPGTNGNFTGATVFDAATLGGTAALAVASNRVVITGLDVLAPATTAGIVAAGDSITDGDHTIPETDTRWPDFLAQRFVEAHRGNGKLPPLVSNAGIGANKVVTDGFSGAGRNLVARFDRDVLSCSGLTDVIVLEGINDIGQSTTFTESADNLIAAYRNLIQRAHAAGVKIYFGTITPFRTDDATAAGTYTGLFSQSQALFEIREPVRQAVNAWILSTNEHDGAIDFNAALSAPGLLNQLYAPYSFYPINGTNDQLHPNYIGYGVMANTVDLNWFTR